MQELSEEINDLSRRVIGGAIAVHRELGPGYDAQIYENALAVELRALDIPFVRHTMAEVFYKGIRVGEGRVDFLVNNTLLVVIKAEEILTVLDTAKVLSLLKALNQPLGLLINFNVPTLKEGIKRVILSQQYRHP